VIKFVHVDEHENRHFPAGEEGKGEGQYHIQAEQQPCYIRQGDVCWVSHELYVNRK
jgi:hypothetical protein